MNERLADSADLKERGDFNPSPNPNERLADGADLKVRGNALLKKGGLEPEPQPQP